MKKSIYTTALNYGHSRIFEGVKYKEIKEFVEKEHNNKFDYYSEVAFLIWFIEAFSSSQITGKHDIMIHSVKNVLLVENQLKDIDITTHRKQYELFTTKYRFFITGESDRKLLEFWELKEARYNARQAFTMAIIAIIISLIGVFLSPLAEHYFNVFLKPLLRQEAL